MSGLFNTISGFKVSEYTAAPKETDTEDSTNYKDVDFSLNFTSVKATEKSASTASLNTLAENNYKKETNNYKNKNYEIEKEKEKHGNEEYKITEKYKENDEQRGFDSES